jgi:hypothetical protein
MKTKTWILSLSLLALFALGCVPEDLADLDKGKICNAAGVVSNSIILTIRSENPLPQNLKVAFNDSDQVFADECDGGKNAKVTFDSDRMKAVVVFNLGGHQDTYDQYFTINRELIDEYFNAQVYSRSSCSSAHDLEQEKLNVLISEKVVSELGVECAKDYTQAFGQFTFQP